MKTRVISDVAFESHGLNVKGGDSDASRGLPLWDELAAYQLVGEVMAHQGL